MKYTLMRSYLILLIIFQSIYSEVSYGQLDQLRDLVSQYVTFEKNMLISLRQSPSYSYFLKSYPGVDQKLKANYKTALSLLKELEEVETQASAMTGENRVSCYNAFLDALFMIRSELLQCRYENYTEHKESRMAVALRKKSKVSFKFVPTDPKELKKLSEKYPRFFYEGGWNLMVSRFNLDRYQMIQIMIKEVYLTIGPKNLTEKNRLWIRASVSLHPFLNGETDDPGFPDQACVEGYYPPNRDDFSLTSCYTIGTHRIGVRKEDGTLEEKTASLYELSTKYGETLLQSLPELPNPAWLQVEKEVPQTPELTLTCIKNALEEIEPCVESGAAGAAHPMDTEFEEWPSDDTFQFKKGEFQKAQSKPLLKPSGVSEPGSSRRDDVSADLSKLSQGKFDWLITLFSNRPVHEYKYRDFESIWNRINGAGSIVSGASRGSHRKLLNKDGKWAGSIFTHGNNHSYSGDYLPYLRKNFEAIGIDGRTLSEFEATRLLQ